MAAAPAPAAHGAAAPGAPAAPHTEPTEAVLFIITCILIGISTQFFLRKVKVPYTALLLVWGLCIGLLQAAPGTPQAWTATLSIWMSIDPHLLLLIFLPTIGFSAALSQQPHLLRRNWGQILILAWPGVVVTFLLIAVCARFFFPYGWSWPQCLLFGAMLSATDPVAVVAVLHEVGADEKLSSVIDGESLVNDGSALVIFLVLQQFVQGASLTAGQITALFCRLALGGAAIGLGFCVVTSLWLAAIFQQPSLEIVLTLGAAYACYFVAEDLAGASGLLAVVVMGFSMSLLGGRHLTQRIAKEMHTFWSVLEWLANTILFLWVGIALGLVLLNPSDSVLRLQELQFSNHLRPADAGYAVLLYVWLLVARACAIGLFYPLLSTGRVGYPLTWQTAVFMVWAGLRGAVGLAMSLFVLFDDLITDNGFKAHCVLFMAVMAFATVLINGTTSKWVLQSLGLLRMTPQQLQVLRHVLQEVDGVADATLADVAPDAVLGPPQAGLVKHWSDVGAAASLSPAHNRVLKHLDSLPSSGRSGGHPESAKTEAAANAALRGHSTARLLPEFRSRLLHVVKASYGEMYNNLEINTGEIGHLQEATDEALDSVLGLHSSPAAAAPATTALPDPEAARPATSSTSGSSSSLSDWAVLQRQMQASSWTSKAGRVARACRLRTLASSMEERKAASQLQLVSAFVAAHSAAQELLMQHLAPKDGAGSSGGAAAVDVQSAEAARVVAAESQAEVDAAMQYAHTELLPAHPHLAPLLVSRSVAISVLQHQRDFLDTVEAAGLVRAEEVHTAQHRTAHKLELLQHQRHWNAVGGQQREAAVASTQQPQKKPAGAAPAGLPKVPEHALSPEHSTDVAAAAGSADQPASGLARSQSSFYSDLQLAKHSLRRRTGRAVP